MSGGLDIALIQTRTPASPSAALAHVEPLIRTAAASGAKLILTPEATNFLIRDAAARDVLAYWLALALAVVLTIVNMVGVMLALIVALLVIVDVVSLLTLVIDSVRPHHLLQLCRLHQLRNRHHSQWCDL